MNKTRYSNLLKRVFASFILGIVATSLRSTAQSANKTIRGGLHANSPLIPILGSEQATAIILVFSDFECFQCGRSAAVLSDILQSASDVKLIFKNAPGASNKEAMLAHEAALAAGAQGKFWEMHDILFANQQRLGRDDLIGYAKRLGLDVNAFRQALDDHRYRPLVEQDLEEAKGLGVTTTPTFLVNGRRLIGPQGEAALQAVVESVITNAPKQPPRRIVASSGPAQTINLKDAPTEGAATAHLVAAVTPLLARLDCNERSHEPSCAAIVWLHSDDRSGDRRDLVHSVGPVFHQRAVKVVEEVFGTQRHLGYRFIPSPEVVT